jgi:MYXO-CTERM domain-containing protein
VDALGDAYVAGFTQSPDFPTVTPFQSTLRGVQNAFIAELAPSGTKLVGSTYLGGSANDATATGNDAATSIAVDSLGGVYVAGYTQSADFPVAHAFQKSLLGSQNAFVAKLLPSFDTLAFSTYVGGSGTDVANAIAVDASNDVFLAGATTSADFPVLGGFQTRYAGQQDAFITEIAAAGNALVYSTFLGGSGTDLASSLALDGSGAAIVVGQTQSVDFPMLGAFQNRNNAPTTAIGNAFAAIVEPSGRHLVGSTYFGGEGGARAQAVAIGAGGAGNAFWMVGGAGANMPTANALYPSYKAQPPNGQNAFLTRLASDAGIELSPDAGGVALDGGPEASNEADGPCVVVVPAASDPQVSRPASSGCGCRVSETQRPPFAEVLGGAIFFGVLSGRRRRSRAATNQ